MQKLTQLIADGDFTEAPEHIHALMTDRPSDSTLLMDGAKVFFELEMYDSSLAYARKLTALYPKNYEGYTLLYKAAGKLEDYDSQIWATSQMSYLDNDRRKYYYELARLNYLRGMYGASIKTCLDILEYDPINLNARFLLSNSLASAGALDSAILVLSEIDSLQPDQVEVVSNMASYYAANRDFTNALKQFRRVTTLYPDYIPGWMGLGHVLIRQGDTAEAEKAYLQAMSRDSTFLGVDTLLHNINPIKY